jgi:hypothetical protein
MVMMLQKRKPDEEAFDPTICQLKIRSHR